MATITPKMVKELREKGIAKAAKKSGRIAAEGAVAAYVSDDKKTGVLFELNCETDFAAKNAEFKALQSKLMKLIADAAPESVEELEGLKLDGKSITDVMGEATATIGEKLSIRRFERYETEGELTSYIHMGGKIGVLVELETPCDKCAASAELAEAAHMICLQIAANAPKYIKPEDVPQSEIDAELEIKLNALKEQKGKLPPE